MTGKDSLREGMERYPVCDPGDYGIDLNAHSRNCFIEGFTAALSAPQPPALSGFTDAEIATEHGWRMRRALGDPRIGVGIATDFPGIAIADEGSGP